MGGAVEGRVSGSLSVLETIFLLCGRTDTADWSEVSPDEESTDFSAGKHPRRGNRGAPTWSSRAEDLCGVKSARLSEYEEESKPVHRLPKSVPRPTDQHDN